jgi:hypothetical protein
MQMSQEDEEMQNRMNKNLPPKFMMMAPRGITANEVNKIPKIFKDQANSKVLVNESSICFEDKQEVYQTSKDLKNRVQAVFNERIEALETQFNERNNAEAYKEKDKLRKISLIRDENNEMDDIIQDHEMDNHDDEEQ